MAPCEVTAGTIKGGDDLEILNPEWHIATLGEGAKLVMELTFDKGRGYVPAERNKQALIEKTTSAPCLWTAFIPPSSRSTTPLTVPA